MVNRSKAGFLDGKLSKTSKAAAAKYKSELAATWGGSKEPVPAAYHETTDNCIA
jgi:hypothetical protein